MSNLSSLLHQLDGSQISIQRAASCMIKMYDSSSYGAVTEWRNALQSASVDHLLPLLYVCNEVLQTSKRNRGNKFLEAYSPVLNQSLQHIAMQLNDPAQTERIRRVVKIWGDRQIFSIRFINELLFGLEQYRYKKSTVQEHQKNQQKKYGNEEEEQQQLQLPTPQITAALSTDETKLQQSSSKDDDIEKNNSSSAKNKVKDKKDGDDEDEDDEDDFMETLETKDHLGVGSTDNGNYNDDDDDDDDVFGDNSQGLDQLKLEINVTDSMVVGTYDSVKAGSKRRRGSLESTSSNNTSGMNNSTKKTKKVTKKSMSHFLDIWNQLLQLKQKFDLAQLTIQRISTKLQNDNSELENLVGDELVAAKKQNDTDIQTIIDQRTILYQTACEQYAVEQQIQNQYYPWFQVALQQDTTDLLFCTTLEYTIQQFQPIHVQIVNAYRAMKMDEDEKNRRSIERERIRKEQEEAEKFRKAALAKETEAKPGMVWNPTTREYQSLNTDESWRD